MNVSRSITAALLLGVLATAGCAGHQYGHLLASDDKDLVGSHAAGSATWNPLVDDAVARLLGRCPPAIQPVVFEAAQEVVHDNQTIGSALAGGTSTICFVGIENRGAEELADFKEQLYERVDSQINSSETFRSVSRRVVDSVLLETRLRPESLFLPHNQRLFAATLEKQSIPVDYLLFAKVTTGSTDRNKTSQRDYALTLELVNVRTGENLKETAKIRKGYSKTRAGKWWNYGPFDQADG